MGWSCHDCKNREYFIEINEFSTKVYQKKSTHIMYTVDFPLGTGARNVRCGICKSTNLNWIEFHEHNKNKRDIQIEAIKSGFRCKDNCAKCCKYWLIIIEDEDIVRIMKTGLKQEEFLSSYGIMKMIDGQCYFLKDNRCSIYDIRPDICKKYPLNNLSIVRFYFCEGLAPFLEDYKQALNHLS